MEKFVPQGYDLRVSPRLGRDGWAQRRGLSLTTPPAALVARGVGRLDWVGGGVYRAPRESWHAKEKKEMKRKETSARCVCDKRVIDVIRE